MKRILFQTVAAIFIASFIISCTDYTTGSDVLKKVDFKKFKTYAWLPIIDSVMVNDINREQLNTYIFTTIDQQLNKRKMTIDTVKPDVLIRFAVILNNSSALVTTPIYESRPAVGYSYGYYGSSMYYYNQTVQVGTQTNKVLYRNGTLVIDLIDHSTNEVVWRGYAYHSKEEDMQRPNLDEMRKKVAEVVADIFWKFPIKR
ncbi:MAG: DUF4136 domain-containing protein [Bacteroidia bacterium]